MAANDWTDVERVEHMCEAIETVDVHWRRLESSGNPLAWAQALIDLSNSISDLRSWHPTYDIETGTLEWERSQE